MSRLFQIYEEDLAELEKILPQFSEAMLKHLSPCQRTQLRRCKAILSNVRWNYGPSEFIEETPVDDSDQVRS